MTDRDIMQYDIVVVGAGPAGLACAIRMKQQRPDLTVCVLEKGAEIGSHILSGCILEPATLDELLPNWRETPPAIFVEAKKDRFRLLGKKRSWWLPTPPQVNNHGNFIISLGSLCNMLATQAENLEVDVFPGFPAAEAIIEDGTVIGVRCGDMGLNADGSQGPNYTPGVDIHARLTVLAEGCRGSVSKQLIKTFELDALCDPQAYALGFKELWQLPKDRSTPGDILHTVGYPVGNDTYGGGFVYELDDDRAYVGYIAGLDYKHPKFNPFEAFQQFKHHPSIAKLLEGGEIISSGARSIVKGGLQSLPKLEMPGAVLVGDAAGTLNFAKIKGVHMALRSGIMVADYFATRESIKGFDKHWRKSKSARELRRCRNMAPGFHFGLWFGLINAVWETITFGWSPWTLKNRPDWQQQDHVNNAGKNTQYLAERNLAPRDRLASVYFASTAHEETQPAHLKVADTNVCVTQCAEEFDNPCTRFCPAQVYEMITQEDGSKQLQINAANCVHCKACDIKDPYELITWTTPRRRVGSELPEFVAVKSKRIGFHEHSCPDQKGHRLQRTRTTETRSVGRTNRRGKDEY